MNKFVLHRVIIYVIISDSIVLEIIHKNAFSVTHIYAGQSFIITLLQIHMFDAMTLSAQGSERDGSCVKKWDYINVNNRKNSVIYLIKEADHINLM
jgi:hypothetical protein